MPSATARNGRCSCRPGRGGAARGPGRSARRRQPVRVPVVRAPARRRGTQGAGRLFDHRAQQPGSDRVRADAPEVARPGLRGHRRRRSDPTPASRALVRARLACRVPAIDSIPTGRPPMRSNASPERVAALLAASAAGGRLGHPGVRVVESLTGPAEAPLSMLAFAGAALAGVAFTRLAARGRRFYRAPWPRSRSPLR